MEQINKILVVVDPTVERDFVLDKAKLVARATGASLHLFINNENTLSEQSYFYEGIDKDFFKTQSKLFRDHYKKLLSEIESELTDAGFTVTSEFAENSHLAESIIEHADAIQANLVIKSTHHHDALERSIITNTDWRLIRKCPLPVMLVKPGEWHDDGKIVTAIDPLHVKASQSRLDHVLLESASKIAGIFKQPVRVFHSYFPFVSALLPLGGESEEYLLRIGDQHRQKVLEVMAEHGLGEDNLELSRGELAPDLVRYLKSSNANLLVIGVLSRNFLERAIVGNTAERILEDCPCDVLVMKTS